MASILVLEAKADKLSAVLGEFNPLERGNTLRVELFSRCGGDWQILESVTINFSQRESCKKSRWEGRFTRVEPHCDQCTDHVLGFVTATFDAAMGVLELCIQEQFSRSDALFNFSLTAFSLGRPRAIACSDNFYLTLANSLMQASSEKDESVVGEFLPLPESGETCDIECGTDEVPAITNLHVKWVDDEMHKKTSAFTCGMKRSLHHQDGALLFGTAVKRLRSILTTCH